MPIKRRFCKEAMEEVTCNKFVEVAAELLCKCRLAVLNMVLHCGQVDCMNVRPRQRQVLQVDNLTFHVGMSRVCPPLLRRASARATAAGTCSRAPKRIGNCLQAHESQHTRHATAFCEHGGAAW